MRQRGGRQSEGGDETGHHDRAKPENRPFHGGVRNAASAGAKLIDVFQHDHSGLDGYAKERKESDPG